MLLCNAAKYIMMKKRMQNPVKHLRLSILETGLTVCNFRKTLPTYDVWHGSEYASDDGL